MSKFGKIVLSGVVYRIKSTGPSTEPRGTPYKSLTLSDTLSLIFCGLVPILQVRRKFDPAHL